LLRRILLLASQIGLLCIAHCDAIPVIYIPEHYTCFIRISNWHLRWNITYLSMPHRCTRRCCCWLSNSWNNITFPTQSGNYLRTNHRGVNVGTILKISLRKNMTILDSNRSSKPTSMILLTNCILFKRTRKLYYPG